VDPDTGPAARRRLRRMLSVIIATLNSERALVPTLAALVPGAMSGLISEVRVADGGSDDDTAAVADIAGCNFMAVEGPLPKRLKAAAGAAKAPWLMFLRPGTILDAPWIGEASRFMDAPSPQPFAAVFRRSAPARQSFGDTLSRFAATLGARPRPEQGLLLPRQFYEALGGHAETAADAETDLLRRIGRRRLVTLSSGASMSRFNT
jgi:hypothetical protein